MKRLGLIISLFLLVLIYPRSTLAANNCCVGRDCSSSQLANYKICSGGGGVRCSTQQDCDTYTGFRIGNPGGPVGQGSSFSPFGNCGTTAVDTALGCISTNFTDLFNKFFSLGIGIAGGIAFLLILFGGFQILTSAGNPEQLAAGRELVGSAITGLLMIIFSVFLLRVIGVDILGIPGFS